MRAVLERDYLSEAARPRAFAARFLLGVFGSLALFVAASAQAASGRDDWDRVGTGLFSLMTLAVFVFLAATVPVLLVGSLLPERRRSTLDLLLASPLGPRGVARGKFLARLGTALTWAAATLPPLTVAVLFGGTSWRALANAALGILASAVQLASWGIVVSAGARRIATAAVLVYLLPGIHWWLAGLLLHEAPPTPWTLLAAATGPAPVLDPAAWDGDVARVFPGGAPWPLRHPGLLLLLASGAMAAVAVPLATRLLAREEGGGRSRLRLPRPKGSGRIRAWITRGNPVAWKESLLLNTAASRSLYYVVILLLVAGEAAFLVLHRNGLWDRGTDFAYLAAVFLVLFAVAAIQGSASMVFEKDQGTFDLLRISRLTPGEIARGKAGGAACCIAFLLLIPLSHLAVATASGYHRPGTAGALAAAAIAIAANASIHGLTWGTVARTPWGALAGAASFPAFAAAGCAVLCLLPFVLAGLRLVRREGATEYFEVIVVPAVLGGTPVLFFYRYLVEADAAGTVEPGLTGGLTLAVLTAGGLAVTVACFLYRWNRLPEVLEREMAKMAEGERGTWRRLRPRPPLPPVRPSGAGGAAGRAGARP